jgi:hypothetical protein
MHIDAAGSGRFPFFMSTLYLSALGALPAAFAISRDNLTSLPSPYSDPPTGQLFMPPAAAMRQDARFEPLIKAVGLEGFWAATGTVPDFRSRR